MNIYAKSICKERVKMLKQCFDNVREKHPLVHNITNYVTVNDVANILLACGGSPIMADDSGAVSYTHLRKLNARFYFSMLL